MSAFQPGEIVDVTIKGVRIDDVYEDGTVNIVAEHSDGGPANWQMPPQAAVTRAAPAEWPPQPGDLWRDRKGMLWFAVERLASEGGEVALTCNGSNRRRVDDIHELYAPLTLVYREAAADGTDGSGQ